MDSLDFRLPTDIQAESIPLILGGGDVLMVSLAYLLVSFTQNLHNASFTSHFNLFIFFRRQKLVAAKPV